MPTIQIHVYNGRQLEPMPKMCMFCGEPLDEDQFQKVPVQIANNPPGNLRLPICEREQPPTDYFLFPDGRNQALDRLGGASTPAIALAAGIAGDIARQKEQSKASFTFERVHPRFARELARLREQTAAEFDQMVARGSDALLQTEEERQKAAQDRAAFGVIEADGPAVEPATVGYRRVVIVAVALFAVVSVLILGVIGILVMPNFKQPKVVAEKKAAAPVEISARIKFVDDKAGIIRFLVGVRHQSFRFDDQTQFLDREGQPLGQKERAEWMRAEEPVLILLSADHQKLRQVKLAPAPK